MIASVTCDQEGFSYSDKLVSKLSEKIKESNDLVPSFEFIPNILNEGFKAPLDVNYCALVGDIEYKPEVWVLSNIIDTEYLWTQVRVLGGAYGCFMNISKELGFYASSYRDPNIANTYEVYKNIIKFLEDFNPSEEEFLKYIIGAVGTVSSPRSPRDLGATSLMCYFDGTTQEQIKKNRMSIINCNLDTIKSFIEPLKKVMNQNIICTIGNEKIVEENKALFAGDDIYNPSENKTSINVIFLLEISHYF